MRNTYFVLAVSLLLLMPAGSFASDYSAFTKDLAVPYRQYKQSLSLTSKKEDAEKAKAAISAFIDGWEILATKYGKDVPTVFSAVKGFPELIARPVTVGRDAKALMEKGEIKMAHNALEEVRYLMWNLRATNGIVALADKANNFHEAMEIVLDKADEAKDAAAMKNIEARFGSWLAVAWEELALAPAAERSTPVFAATLLDGRSAVSGLRTALQSGDRQAAKQYGTAVKNSYKKIFFMD